MSGRPPLPPELQRDFEGDENQINRDSLDRLVDALRSRGVVPVVGAGLSSPFGLSLWYDFLLKGTQEAGLPAIPDPHAVSGEAPAALEVRAALDAGFYEQVATALIEENRLLFNSRVDDRFGSLAVDRYDWAGAAARPNDPGLPAVFLLPRLAPGPVITTNFDGVLERVYETARQPFRPEDVVWGPDAGVALPRLSRNHHFLLKLHGGTEPGRQRIFTGAEYDRQYGNDPLRPDLALPLPELLAMLARSRSFLFLGCSLKQDRTMPVLKAAAERLDLAQHFALMPRPAAPEELRAIQRRLYGHAIRPVFYDPSDGHARVRSLLEYLLASVEAPDPADP